MSKKIGIMTYSRSLNYGSALQAFALAYYLEDIGYDVEIIDYVQRNYGQNYSLIKAPFSLNAIKCDIIHLLVLNTLKRRKAKFTHFRKSVLPMSKKKYKFGDDLTELDSIYDVIICGSDQIWNPKATDFDTNYFLPFINTSCKISYAVSINGGDLINVKDNARIVSNLQRFHALSVREETGKIALNNLLSGKKDINVSLDPTLLNPAQVYDGISSSRIVKEPYIFFYSVNFRQDAVEAALTLSERTGLPVYTLFTGLNRTALKAKKRFVFATKSVGVEDFISYIKYADYVVTNSFHGTAFSIIFEKKFFSIGSTGEDGCLIPDARICHLLELLGIESCFVSKDMIKTVNLNESIDYSQVNERRKEGIMKSVSYLKESIGGTQS